MFKIGVALLLALLAVGRAGNAIPDPNSSTDLIATLTKGTSPECRSRILEIPEFPLLMALLGPQAKLLANPKASLVPAFQSWSSDLLLKMILELEQGFESPCGEAAHVRRLIVSMRTAYLEKLGIPFRRQKEPEKLFRALIAIKDEAQLIAKKLKVSKAKTTDAVLKEIYGEVGWLGKVAVVGASKEQRKMLQDFVTLLCPKTSSCVWWDDRAIYKVVVTAQPGVAAYVPELAQLVLSGTLLTQPTRLHQVVLLHELVHGAERMAWVLRRQKWAEEFGAFSGWEKKEGKLSLKVRERKVSRQDLLVELSLAGSPFSILPDPLVAAAESGKDGFVMAKTYRATQERGDLSEDLADHAAIFRLVPERFCFEGKNVAPRKAEWIHKNMFPESSPPTCH